MNINIIATQNVSEPLIKSVLKLLTGSKSGFEFNYVGKYEIKSLVSAAPELKRHGNKILSFNSLFKICNLCRSDYKFDSSDYVVLLTEFDNKEDWFSAVSKKNIFIDIKGWEGIIKREASIGIAYQVFENVFQSLIKIDWEKARTSKKYIHQKTKGCINDFCENKEDVLFKIKSADICDDCLQFAKKQKVSVKDLSGINQGLEFIRPLLKSLNGSLISDPQRITISKDFKKVFIGNTLLALSALEQTILIFFLLHQSASTFELERKKEVLNKIYERISTRVTLGSIDKFFKGKTLTTYFRKVKSDLNEKLIQQLGKPLAEYYIVRSSKKTHLVKVTPNYLENKPQL